MSSYRLLGFWLKMQQQQFDNSAESLHFFLSLSLSSFSPNLFFLLLPAPHLPGRPIRTCAALSAPGKIMAKLCSRRRRHWLALYSCRWRRLRCLRSLAAAKVAAEIRAAKIQSGAERFPSAASQVALRLAKSLGGSQLARDETGASWRPTLAGRQLNWRQLPIAWSALSCELGPLGSLVRNLRHRQPLTADSRASSAPPLAHTSRHLLNRPPWMVSSFLLPSGGQQRA